ncbi:MAG: response regulator, partial [Lentisphaerae bacterium]
MPQPSDAPQAKVLIVDDEMPILNAIERCLRREGFTIIKANG